MHNKDIAITADNIGKCYRIGLKEEAEESLANTFINFIKSPVHNYRKYRSLYTFDQSETNSSDIIWALRDISFDVRKGEIVGIIGRNGAGKSTLLKILSRITSPTTGTARISGRVSSLLEVGTGFHDELTGRENIYLNGTILGMTKKEVDRKLEEIIAFSGIEKFVDTPVKRYSSGMKMRLAFSVAAHLEPEILIIDEVLAVGDAAFQKKCLSKMETVGQDGRTVLFVSHNMPAVARLCNRVILLDEGKMVEDGGTHDVITAYLNAGYGSPAERLWPDPETAPGNDIVRLRSVSVTNGKGRVSTTIDMRQSIRLEMKYDVMKSGTVLVPTFLVYNDEGILVFIVFDMDDKWKNHPRPKGCFVSSATIPGNFLSEGTLYVSPIMNTFVPHMRHFYERDAIAFQVTDNSDGDSARNDYKGHIRGVVSPLLKWETRFSQ
jgi:lipopolysaccharide transport system ATP-binding protein